MNIINVNRSNEQLADCFSLNTTCLLFHSYFLLSFHPFGCAFDSFMVFFWGGFQIGYFFFLIIISWKFHSYVHFGFCFSFIWIALSWCCITCVDSTMSIWRQHKMNLRLFPFFQMPFHVFTWANMVFRFERSLFYWNASSIAPFSLLLFLAFLPEIVSLTLTTFCFWVTHTEQRFYWNNWNNWKWKKNSLRKTGRKLILNYVWAVRSLKTLMCRLATRGTVFSVRFPLNWSLKCSNIIHRLAFQSPIDDGQKIQYLEWLNSNSNLSIQQKRTALIKSHKMMWK